MASLIVIKNYEVVEKIRTEIPDKIEGIVKCVNPKCITNSEVIRTKFDVVDKENLEMRCHYCEKFTSKDTISPFKKYKFIFRTICCFISI